MSPCQKYIRPVTSVGGLSLLLFSEKSHAISRIFHTKCCVFGRVSVVGYSAIGVRGQNG